MRRLLPHILPVLMIILLTSCLKKPDSGTIIIEKSIKAELPVLYSGVNIKTGSKVVIRRQTTLDSVFTSEVISQLPELQNFNFNLYDVLVSADTYIKGISALEHHLLQSSNSIYIYKLYVHSDLTRQEGVFYYGIIIDKIPQESNVIFEVDKLE